MIFIFFQTCLQESWTKDAWLFKFKPGGAVCESDPKGCMPACEGQRSSNATCHTLPRGMCKGSYVVIDAWPSPRNGGFGWVKRCPKPWDEMDWNGVAHFPRSPCEVKRFKTFRYHIMVSGSRLVSSGKGFAICWSVESKRLHLISVNNIFM